MHEILMKSLTIGSSWMRLALLMVAVVYATFNVS